MSSAEPRPAKIYFIQFCAQQMHRSDCMDEIIPLYCHRNSKHLSRPYKTYLTKLSSQNAEQFLITEITPNSIHISKPSQ